MVDNRIVSLRVISTGELSRKAHGNETGFGSDREAAAQGRALAQEWCAASRSCSSLGSFAASGQRLGVGVGREKGSDRQAQSQAAGSASAFGRRTVGRSSGDLADWSVDGRICDGALDDQASARRDQRSLRSRVFDVWLLEPAAQHGFLAAKTGEASHAAQRRSHCGMEA